MHSFFTQRFAPHGTIMSLLLCEWRLREIQPTTARASLTTRIKKTATTLWLKRCAAPCATMSALPRRREPVTCYPLVTGGLTGIGPQRDLKRWARRLNACYL
jgi:hypothetical protein